MMCDEDIRIAVTTEVPDVEIEVDVEGRYYPEYAGPYSVVPGAIAQILRTGGMVATEDIIIGAIPDNYGLITYNGSNIIVS